jgi:hypothetical protein
MAPPSNTPIGSKLRAGSKAPVSATAAVAIDGAKCFGCMLAGFIGCLLVARYWPYPASMVWALLALVVIIAIVCGLFLGRMIQRIMGLR